MILFNITTKIDLDVHDVWLNWMKEDQLPRMLGTGCFTDYKMFRILEDNTTDGITYAVQFFANTMGDYFDYTNKHATAFQKEMKDAFPDKYVTFQTVLKEV